MLDPFSFGMLLQAHFPTMSFPEFNQHVYETSHGEFGYSPEAFRELPAEEIAAMNQAFEEARSAVRPRV